MYSNRTFATDTGATALAITVIGLWVLSGIGWVWNIVKVFGAGADPITTMQIMRIVGVFVPPIGAVLGWL